MKFTHVFSTGCCPTACTLPGCPAAQLTKIFVLCFTSESLKVKMKCQEQRLSASIEQSGWGSTAGCQLLYCVLFPLSLSLIQRGRAQQSLSHGHVFLSSQFFQTFPHMWRTDSREREEEQTLSMWHGNSGKCTSWIRLLNFIWSGHTA